MLLWHHLWLQAFSCESKIHSLWLKGLEFSTLVLMCSWGVVLLNKQQLYMSIRRFRSNNDGFMPKNHQKIMAYFEWQKLFSGNFRGLNSIFFGFCGNVVVLVVVFGKLIYQSSGVALIIWYIHLFCGSKKVEKSRDDIFILTETPKDISNPLPANR